MSTENSEAVIIRQADFSESSRVVTVFSRDFGKLAMVAKGARRLKGPFDAALDLLSTCQITFIRKSSTSLDILTESKLTRRFRPQTREMACLYGGYYVAELLDGLTEEYDPHLALFDSAIITLSQLATGESALLSVLRFELTILKQIGQLPVFDACVACGEPVVSDREYGYWVSQGGLICTRCQRQEFKGRNLRPDTIAILSQLSADHEAESDISITANQIREMRALTISTISHILGRRPKMVRYLQS